MIETDVLIVGSGPAGSSAALMLSTYGIPNVIVTKYGWLANASRAHLNNQRTVEILRDLGVEPEVVAKASPQDIMGNAVFCTCLTGSRNKFVANTDGSVDLYLQAESPGKAKEAHCLPAPKANFSPRLRLYWPDETPPSIIDGTWKPPAIKAAS